VIEAFFWGALGASALLIGALVAYVATPSPNAIGVVMALGTGLLIGSVPPPRAYAPTRGWQDADIDTGFERLQRRGLMTDDEQLTDAGRAFREEIEVRTDELERPVLDALGDDLDELLQHLDAWSDAIIAGGSYPRRIAGVYNVVGGPHFGSGLTIDTAAEHYANKA
jgi:hypothetical protein